MSEKHGVNAKQVEAVLSLDGPQRVEHFVKVVVDREEAWGLYDEGWASTATETDERAFPLWPGHEYAEACVADEWSRYTPRPIALDELIDTLMPMLKEQGALAAVLQTPSGKGVTVAPDDLVMMLRAELERH